MHSHQYRYDITYDIVISIIYAISIILQPSEACTARPVHAKACPISHDNIRIMLIFASWHAHDMRGSECHACEGSERPRPASPTSSGTAVSWRCQNRCARAQYMHASMNRMNATCTRAMRTPSGPLTPCTQHVMPCYMRAPCHAGENEFLRLGVERHQNCSCNDMFSIEHCIGAMFCDSGKGRLADWSAS